MHAIGTGISGVTALRFARAHEGAAAQSLARLATGQRINRAADDPAGLIASENLRAVLAALDAESRSLERTDHVIATADGALAEVSDRLVEAEALAVANANSAGLSDAEREANQMEINSIVSSVNRIASTTTFNGQKLLDGSATVTAGDASLTIEAVGLTEPIGEGGEAQAALREARSQVSSLRGELGAFSGNIVGAQLNNLAVTTENVAAAESAIRDTDYAQELAELIRERVLASAAWRSASISAAEAVHVLALLG